VKTLSDHKELDFGVKYGFAIEELRLLARGIVVVGADGVVKYVQYVPEITTHPDYEAALKAAKN
jgi:thiol peroxidase